MKTCHSCKKTFPSRMEIHGKIRNLSTRKLCLECSPFGAHNTRLPEQRRSVMHKKRCPRCMDIKSPDEFYRRRNGTDLSVYCKSCATTETLERQRKLKQQAVDHKGGCCQCCGYNKHIGSLEFHHRDPREKDFSISRAGITTFQKIVPELDKCVLVCRNCHGEIHGGLITLSS